MVKDSVPLYALYVQKAMFKMLVAFGLSIYQPKMLLRLSAAGYHFNRGIFYMIALCSSHKGHSLCSRDK